MKKAAKFWVILFTFILVIAAHPIWLPLPAKFLLVKDNIEKADVIVVLSGDWNFSREKQAVELYKKGFAKKIIRILEKENPGWFNIVAALLNLDVAQKDLYVKYFESRGVPKDAFILGERIATSTLDELNAAKDIILKNNFKAMILVTDNYHMRRALMTARWVFKPCRIKIYNASIYSIQHPARWWLYEADIKAVVMEYLSIFFYLIYHFMLGR